jgi:hypothetical protein
MDGGGFIYAHHTMGFLDGNDLDTLKGRFGYAK